SSLDVVLVQKSADAEPNDASLLAQSSNRGGGEQTRPERPTTPVPTPLDGPTAEVVASSPEARPAPATPEPVPEATPVPKPAPAAQVEPDAIEESPAAVVMTQDQARTDDRVAAQGFPRPRAKPQHLRRPRLARTNPAPASAPDLPRLNASRLVSRSIAMASLSAEVDRKLNAYAQRPRSKWVSASTREVKYAAYMEAWRAKVERIGNMNYPDEARRKRLSGKLVLHAAINKDGSLKSVKIRRSSGQRVLDDAALRIVRLASPYAPFPDSFRDEIDVLHIERTWRFLGSNRLAAR
ncbi:MAG: TonB family protein, partial [Pseudomonadota bacterium]